MHNLRTLISPLPVLAPGLYKTVQTSAAIPVAGYEGVTIEITAGTLTDGTYTFTINEAPDGETWTAVAANCLLFTDLNPASNAYNQQAGGTPTLAPGAGNGQNTINLVDYIGSQPYIQVVVNVAGGPATGVELAINAIRSSARHKPAGVTQVP